MYLSNLLYKSLFTSAFLLIPDFVYSPRLLIGDHVFCLEGIIYYYLLQFLLQYMWWLGCVFFCCHMDITFAPPMNHEYYCW